MPGETLRLEGGNYFIINHDFYGRAPDEVERGQRQHPSIEAKARGILLTNKAPKTPLIKEAYRSDR